MFVEALGGIDVARLAPAVTDWLRWKYQRLQIDTANDAAWMEVRVRQLPTRVERAGERPQLAVEQGPYTGVAHAVWHPKSAPYAAPSRRSVPDQPRTTKAASKGTKLRVGRPQTGPVDIDEQVDLLKLYRDHAEILGPIMDITRSEAKKWAVLRTLRAHLNTPHDSAAHQRWLALVQATLVPPMASRTVF